MTKLDTEEPPALFYRYIGGGFASARDFLAAGFTRIQVKPTTLTLCGLIVTLLAGFCLALGAGDHMGSPRRPDGTINPATSWFGLYAAILLFLASAFDILDGAVARHSGRVTKMGGFLDSCFDRVADAAIFLGIAWYYISHLDEPGARLYLLLGLIAFFNAEMTSYIKARAENFIPSCPVGFWQRGEREAAILIGLFSHHLPTAVALLAISGAFTVLRRIVFTSQQLLRTQRGEPLLDPFVPARGVMRLALWRHRRGRWGYDLTVAFYSLIIIFVDFSSLATGTN